VNFDFSEDERMVQDQVRRYLGERCPPEVVRTVLDGQLSYAESVWRGLGEMGLMGTALPEAYGGSEAGYLTLCLVAQELGRSVAPTPFASSIYLAAEALALFGTEDQKQRWLPRLASGEAIGTLAEVEYAAGQRLGDVRAEGGKLTGSKLIVPDGELADVAVVLADDGQAGGGLYLAALDDTVRRSTLDTVDPTRNSATLTFDGTAAEKLAHNSSGEEALAQIYDRAAVLIAFEQLGGAEAALDMAVAYAKERFAFGRPIGSFQGLKHMMADMYVALKLAESNCYYAAWALASNAPELPLAAATARVSATQAYQLCSRDNIQVHGGMGFTWEFDCHLYYRRSNYLALQLGGLKHWEDRLVASLPLGAVA